MRHFCFQKYKAIELHSFSKTAATLFIPKYQFLLNISNHKNNFFGYWIIFNLCTWNEKMLSNYWTKVWNSGHGVYPDSRKRKGFMHKIITKIIEPTKTITQSMKKQFVTWFITFCPCKNRDEVLFTLGCLNVKLLNPWVIFVKVLWNRYCRIQCTEKKKICRFWLRHPKFQPTFSANFWAFWPTYPKIGHPLWTFPKDPFSFVILQRLQRFLDFFDIYNLLQKQE